MPFSPDIEAALDRVAGLLKDSRRVLLITGAGISADSGLPTYRGVGGLYNDETTEEGYRIEACLSASMFRTRPEITWKYMLRIAEAVFRCKPNVAHETIARWERDFKERGGNVVVLTQNIDGYHRAAGSKNVLEIHGSLHELYCIGCDWRETIPPDISPESAAERLAGLESRLPPRCPVCGDVIRPRIVLFEEMLPRDVLRNFDEEFRNGDGFDLVFSVGTSAMFPYITGPVAEASRRGRPTIEINPTQSDLSRLVDIYLPLRAAEAFAALDGPAGPPEPS